MKSFVYLVQNKINNKCYVGKANDLKARWWQHKHTDSAIALHNAIVKYGENNFSIQILKECSSEEEAFEYERVLIKLFELQIKEYGYNIADGGRGNNGLVVKEETKQLYRDLYTGSKSVHAKFTDQDVVNILTEYADGKTTTYELAKKYNCGKSTMIKLIEGQTYSNVKFNRNFDDIKDNNRISRLPSGSANNMAKLSEKDIPYIRNKYATGKYSYQDIANEFNITKENVWNIIKYKTWKNVK
jgi:group I intron endonuclease